MQSQDFSLDRLVPGKPFHLDFTVQNQGEATIPKFEVHIVGEKAIRSTAQPCDAIPGWQTRNVRVKINVNHTDNFRDYPTNIRVQLKRNGKPLEECHVVLSAKCLRTPITSFAAPAGRSKVNIMLFGEFGSGKTSLILTMLSALAGKLILAHPQLGPIGGGSGHASTTFREIPLTKAISIWDPWGASASNYENDEFKYMVQGALPKGWVMGKAPRLDDLAEKATRDRNKPDAIFFMITQSLVEDSSYLQRLKGWLNILKRERPELNPFIILSQIDQIDPKLRTNPTLENDLLQDKITKVASETGVPEMQIFPTVSYKTERENKDVIDRFVLDILFTAASQASFIHTGGTVDW